MSGDTTAQALGHVPFPLEPGQGFALWQKVRKREWAQKEPESTVSSMDAEAHLPALARSHSLGGCAWCHGPSGECGE